MENEAMGIGATLKAYVGNRQGKTIALEWGEVWEAQGGQHYTAAHLVSSLSRLLNDDPVGVRFFFQTPERSDLLFEAIGVPAEERRPILNQAHDLMVPLDQQPAKLVIDVTPWLGGRDDLDNMFRAVESVVLRDGGLFPAVVLLTDAQYRVLPRTFDDWQDRVRVCRVDDDGVTATLQQEAGAAALVLSPARFHDFSRWVAIDLVDGKLELEPTDGIAEFLANGALAPLPRVAEPVLDNGKAEVDVELPSIAGELRRLMVQLSTEAGARSLDWDAARRVAVGNRLGIPVSSTPEERAEVHLQALQKELASLGGPDPIVCDAEELARLLVRAKTRDIPPTVRRVDHTLHLLNLPRGITDPVATDSAVQVHTVVAPPTALARIIDALSTWVEEDYLRDPYLEGVTRALVAPDEDARILEHALTSILHAGRKPAAKSGELIADPLSRLAGLVDSDLPSVAARVLAEENGGSASRLLARRDDITRQLDAKEPWLVGRPPWLRDVLAREADPLVWVRFGEWSTSRRYESEEECPLYLPPPNWDPSDSDKWLTSVEHSPAFGMTPSDTQSDQCWRYHSWGPPYRAVLEAELESLGWEAIRTVAAQLWMAMQRALAAGTAISTGPGVVVVDLSPGVSGLVTLTSWPSGAGAALEMRVLANAKTDQGVVQLRPATADALTGVHVGGYKESRTLPTGFELTGQGMVARMELLTNSLTATGFGASAVARVAAHDDSD